MPSRDKVAFLSGEAGRPVVIPSPEDRQASRPTFVELLRGLETSDAIHAGSVTVSREELQLRTDALEESLVAAGALPGHVVGVALPNRPCAIVALFAIWQVGAVHAPLNPRASDDDLRTSLEQLNPSLVITDPKTAERMDGWPVLEFDDSGVGNLSEPASPRGDAYDADVALIQFTSGTTGRPKPVKMLHSNVLDLIDRVVGTIRTGRKDSGESTAGSGTRMPNLVPVSLSLWAGIYQVLFAFRVGAPVVIMERFETEEFARLVQRYRVRSSVLPPAAMTMLCNDARITDLRPLKTVRAITAPLDPARARRFSERFGVTVLNGYGQTELGGEVVGWTAADAREHGSVKLGSVGRPNRGIEVAILTDDGVTNLPDRLGEVLVRTPATREGEMDKSFADRLMTGGWFRTGDVGSVDADGFVWVSGRVSDMINRGGLKVYPSQVEEVLLSEPAVGDAAVVGVPDDRVGEVPWAWVVAAPGWEFDAAALEQACRQRLTAYKVPARFLQIDALPRNEVGKVIKRELAERFEGAG
jgi:long-chain acyl-CoA synthetase